MSVKLTETLTATATGTVATGLGKFPEGGATFTARLSAGTATVRLRAWVESGAKETLATFVLPVPVAVPANPKTGDLFDTLPVYSVWNNFEWVVDAIAGGGTLSLSTVGVGI